MNTLALALVALVLVAAPVALVAQEASASHACVEWFPCCHVIDCGPEAKRLLRYWCEELNCPTLA